MKSFLPIFAMLEKSSWIEIFIIGIVAGLLLDLCLKGNSYGFWGNSLLGFIGAIMGGFLWDRFLAGKIIVNLGSVTIQFNMVLMAFIGAIALWLMIKMIGRGRKQ